MLRNFADDCSSRLLSVASLPLIAALFSISPAANSQEIGERMALAKAAADAEQQLHQTFTNLQFEDFGPAPVKGPLYQASAGGRIVYYAPESEHLLFASIFDKNGVNLTALAQEAGAAKRLKAIDTAVAFAVGPENAPTIIEFTDPDCPYCRALDRYWAAKAAEGKPVRRLVFFVSGIHPEAAAKASIFSAHRTRRLHSSLSTPAPRPRCSELAPRAAPRSRPTRGLSARPVSPARRH